MGIIIIIHRHGFEIFKTRIAITYTFLQVDLTDIIFFNFTIESIKHFIKLFDTWFITLILVSSTIRTYIIVDM